MDDDTLVYFGKEVKALDDKGRVGGYLVRFSTETDPDLTLDYFDQETDFGEASKLPVLYNHGFDEKIGRKRIGVAEIRQDEAGLWAEAQLKLRDDYEKYIFEMAQAGKLGWSSGAAAHTVERKAGAKAAHITQWFIAEASLTPTPAEPRNTVMSLKSLIPSGAADAEDAHKNTSGAEAPKDANMEKEELKAMLEESNKSLIAEIEAKAAAAAVKAVEEKLDSLPEVKVAMNSTVQVTVDEADREFKSLGENLIAVANVAKGIIHPRLRGLKAMDGTKAATGLNEAVPSQGEFLLEPTIAAGLLKPIHDAGIFTSLVNRLPVGANSNSGYLNGVDETSRATGSRWGGVQGYHLAEAAALTSSKPKFRRINWELHKVGVLVYATDELLQDANLLSAVINQSAAEELDFMMNDDILNGIGGDRPVGVLNGANGSLISVARAATNNISHADILGMWKRMPARNKAAARWFVNTECMQELNELTFTSGSTGILSPYIGYRPDGVMQIMGRPVIETEFNAALGTAGDILLADMSEYLFFEKGGVQTASSIHLQFLYDETAFRFITRYDGVSSLASALTPYKGTATQSPFVCLSASTS